MRTRLILGSLLLWASVGDRLSAQIGAPPAPAAPAAPGVPAAPDAAAVPAAPAAPAQPMTLWNYLGISHANCQKCRDQCCATPLGQLLNSMTQPLTFATGGLVQPLCPPKILTAAQAEQLSPEEGAAAAIKKSEAEAKARRAAIRYLGTVDCHYFPEAEKGLIAGLRSDTNECVRWEAAMALAKGCCCSKATIAALTLTVTGGDSDKNPAETSERVRAAAAYALQICMCRYQEHITTPQTPPEPPPPDGEIKVTKATELAGHAAPPTGVTLTAYYTNQVPRESLAHLVQDAGRALAAKVGTPQEPRLVPPGQRSLFGIVDTARSRHAVQEEIPFDEAAIGPAADAPPRRSVSRGVAADEARGEVVLPIRPAGQ
jgi:hypothetical protein